MLPKASVNKVLVIVPAYNEQDSITKVIQDLLEQDVGDVLVIDDGSTDATLTIVNRFPVYVISLPYNMGAWRAMQTGMRFALQNNYTHSVTFDADGQHLACSIDTLLSAKDNHNNVVIGSFPQRGDASRRIAWSVFRKISRLKVKDLTSGLRLYDVSSMQVLTTREATLFDYQDLGVLMLLQSYGLTLKEVTVSMEAREQGKSRIFNSWLSILTYMMYTLLLSFSKLAKKKTLETQRD